MRSPSRATLYASAAVLFLLLLWRSEPQVASRPAEEVPQPKSILGAPPLPVSTDKLPPCSLLFFFHIVKTGGTTMRAVLQRNVQLGEFEYIYTGSVNQPRWQLIMHQLMQNVAPRRLIVEIHGEWGIQRSFFADVRRIREMYEEPLRCRVNVVTMLRHPVLWYLSLWNWRASTTIPLCQYLPARDGLSRQITGHRVNYLANRDEREIELGEAPLSALRHFDVVGLTELFDETLLLLARKAGLRHLGYAKLAENARDHIATLAHAVSSEIFLAVGGLSKTDPLIAPVRGRSNVHGMKNPNVAASSTVGSTLGFQADDALMGLLRSHPGSIRAIERLSVESRRLVEARAIRIGAEKAKAPCVYYPCDRKLDEAKGVWNSSFCDGISGVELLRRILNRTLTDRVVHAAVLERIKGEMSALGLVGAELKGRMERLQEAKKRVSEWRIRDMNGKNGRLCGTLKCAKDIPRSCVGCRSNVVPAIEGCWPPWEDQFAPDEHVLYCKRSWTHYPAFDQADIDFRHYPSISPIPCWQTCWEEMFPDHTATTGVTPTCFPEDPDVAFESAASVHGAPRVQQSGLSTCKALRWPRLRCSPSCLSPLAPNLSHFWTNLWLRQPGIRDLDSLNISCPCGPGA